MAEFTQDINTQIAQKLGMTGTAGDGAVDAYLRANPQLIDQYESQRKAYDPSYSAQILRETATPTVQQYTANQIQNPTLPNGGSFTPTLLQVQGNELLSGPAPIDPNAITVNPVQAVAAQTIATSLANAPQVVDSNASLSQIDTSKSTYNATKTTDVGAMEAAQGAVNELATVQGQLKALYADIEEGVPEWAKGAVRGANELMAARNMGASSLGGMAITAAIQESAFNIAAPDAATYFNMDMANLNNKQAAVLETFRARQQNMLTDTAAENAASQFNASSSAQTQQFMAGLVADIGKFNSNLKTTVETFNASEKNKIAAQNAGNDLAAQNFNAQMQSQIDTFNANLENQREQFNSNMAFAIEQSNVLWRRQVNTGNTTAVNAANQVNVQNAFNMSATSQNQLWQQWRDEASWAFSAAQSQINRDFQLGLIAGDREWYNQQTEDNVIEDLIELSGMVLSPKKFWV